jgi:hypothetical protein
MDSTPSRDEAISFVLALAERYIDNTIEGLAHGREVKPDTSDDQLREWAAEDFVEFEDYAEIRDFLRAEQVLL